MIKLVKKLKQLPTSQSVLNHTKIIREIKKAEGFKDLMGLKNNIKSYEKLERIGYKLAVKKANTPEEIEKCVTEVEENYCGDLDSDQWAEQIRIKAYGIEWYLSKYIRSPQYDEFVRFIDKKGIENLSECLSN